MAEFPVNSQECSGGSSAFLTAVLTRTVDTLENALAIWPRYVLFDLENRVWGLGVFPFKDFSLCEYSNFRFSCHSWNGVDNIYYQYNQRQDLLIRNYSIAPLHFSVSPSVLPMEGVPQSPCSGCCPCTSLALTFLDEHPAPGIRARIESPLPMLSLSSCICLAVLFSVNLPDTVSHLNFPSTC